MVSNFTFLSSLMETVLNEMALERKKMIRNASSLGKPIATHIIKTLYLNVRDETRNHWLSEIDAWLTSVNEMKLNGRTERAKLRPMDYFDALFHKHLGNIKKFRSIVDTIQIKEPRYNFNNIDEEEMYKQLAELYMSICSDLGAYDKFRSIRDYIDLDGTLKISQ